MEVHLVDAKEDRIGCAYCQVDEQCGGPEISCWHCFVAGVVDFDCCPPSGRYNLAPFFVEKNYRQFGCTWAVC